MCGAPVPAPSPTLLACRYSVLTNFQYLGDIQRYCHDAPLFMVGLKKDLRKPSMFGRLRFVNLKEVSIFHDTALFQSFLTDGCLGRGFDAELGTSEVLRS